MSPHPPESKLPIRRGWRIAGGLVLVLALGLVFWGYTTPDMQIHWENLAALCGFDSPGRKQAAALAVSYGLPSFAAARAMLAAGAHAGRTAFLS